MFKLLVFVRKNVRLDGEMYNTLSFWIECCIGAQITRFCGVMAGAFALRVFV